MKASQICVAIAFISNVALYSQTPDARRDDSTYYDLQQAYLTPEKVYRLVLTHQKINIESADLSVFTNLTFLALAHDSLFNLPKGLEKLKNLKILDISANNFTLLPAELSLIPNLEELYLNNEQHLNLKQGFEVINKITHLKKLHLDSIPNFKFPKHFKLNNSIEYLSLRYNNLERIPDNLNKITHLKTLDLDGNAITTIGRGFLKNKEIESLIITISPQFKFKKSFLILSKETKLNSLTISNSQFETIPGDIALLTNVTSLSLRNDHLTVFPESILRMKNLKSLDLSGNDFKSIPSTLLFLNKLETINLSNDNYLNFNNAADVIRYLPSLRVIEVDSYDFTFEASSYRQFRQSKHYIELFPATKQNKEVHLFKRLEPLRKPVLNTPFNNFNAEGFGIRLGW